MINITLPNFNFDIPVVGEVDPAGNDKSKTDKYYEILVPHLPWKKGGGIFSLQ
ncbi:hypothetical protein [Paenibacillus sp. DP01]|uniref:hypothetical protein n=1 Tax=Paenibacillus sp. DP01 TaxID=3373096 RepID=UPI00384C0354